MAKKTIKNYFDSIAELIDFNFYYLILVKYKKTLLIVPIFIGGLAFLIALNLQPIYESSATLVIESKDRSLVKNIEIFVPSYLELIMPGTSEISDTLSNIVYSSYPVFQWNSDYCSNCNYSIRI